MPDFEALLEPLRALLPLLLLGPGGTADAVVPSTAKTSSAAVSCLDGDGGDAGDSDSGSGVTPLKLCHLSLLVATPGTGDQTWHADGGHVRLDAHLPCHCFNVFIPLQDTPHCMGPTEFRPGTHYLTRNLAPMMLAAKCRKTLRSPIWPALKLGDAVLFDYRVLHRGRAYLCNDGVGGNGPPSPPPFATANRSYLVMTFCQPWFRDVLNFPKRSMHDTTGAGADATDAGGIHSADDDDVSPSSSSPLISQP